MKLSKSILALFPLLIAASTWAQATKLNAPKIDEITGLKGKLNEAEGVYKVSAPRTDVKISVDESLLERL